MGAPHAIETNCGDIGRDGGRRRAVADALNTLIESATNTAGRLKVGLGTSDRLA